MVASLSRKTFGGFDSRSEDVMTNQQPELQPNVDFDPSEEPGSFQFTEYPAFPASELELASEDPATESGD